MDGKVFQWYGDVAGGLFVVLLSLTKHRSIQDAPLPAHRSGTRASLSRDDTQTISGTAVRSTGTPINGRLLKPGGLPGWPACDGHTLAGRRPGHHHHTPGRRIHVMEPDLRKTTGRRKAGAQLRVPAYLLFSV
jgi:hypothetical protein